MSKTVVLHAPVENKTTLLRQRKRLLALQAAIRATAVFFPCALSPAKAQLCRQRYSIKVFLDLRQFTLIKRQTLKIASYHGNRLNESRDPDILD